MERGWVKVVGGGVAGRGTGAGLTGRDEAGRTAVGVSALDGGEAGCSEGVIGGDEDGHAGDFQQ